MSDVTHLFADYRESVRHLWNAAFRHATAPPSWDSQEAFEHVADCLFYALVLFPLGLSGPQLPSKLLQTLIAGLRIVPDSEHGVPIMISRDQEGSGYWDHPVNRVGPNDAELEFVGFFDFDQLGFRNFRYYDVLIRSSLTHPEIAGRAALLDCDYAKVFYEKPRV
jgi:hypothetical protein